MNKYEAIKKNQMCRNGQYHTGLYAGSCVECEVGCSKRHIFGKKASTK